MGKGVFHQTVDLFLYSYEADLIQVLLKKYEKKLARSFNFTSLYIEDVLSLNNCKFCDFVDRIYHIVLVRNKKNTQIQIGLFHSLTYTSKLTMGDNFNFPIVNYPFIYRNIPAALVYGIYISQLIRYSKACGSYQHVLNRELLLTRKILNHEFLTVKLKSSLRKFYGRYHDLVNRYDVSVSPMTTDVLRLS